MLGSAFDLGRSIGDFNESVRTSGGFRGAFYADQYGDCAATSKIFDFAQRHGRQSPDVRPGAGKWMVIERNTERFDLNCPLPVAWKAWHIRSEERRVGKERVRTCKYGCSPYH